MAEKAWAESVAEEIVGESAALNQVLASAQRLAARDAAVLIVGERGSGKELFARAIHRMSPRRNNSFVQVNCLTTTRDQLERQLFGYEKGAFDGAISDKVGGLEMADKGTLFLNEVAHFPLDLQPKLVRLLKRGEFERLGSTSIIRVNVRLMASTGCRPEKIADDRLQQALHCLIDLFDKSSIQIPPLRERREDIPLLAWYFMRKFARRMNKDIETIAPEIINALQNHDWPGNVAQLENFIHHSVVLTDGCKLNAPLDEL
ncbi:MAG: sigma 54-interacting transcriptional regulator [Terriglobales bacterium]